MKALITFLSFCLLSLPSSALADKKHSHKHKHDHKHEHDHQHKSLSAHVHGVASLSIAVDQEKMSIELKAPAESLLGFEQAPTTKEQKEKWRSMQEAWIENLWDIFVFPKDLGCLPGQHDLQLKVDDSHADIEATALINCKKDLAAQQIELQLMKKFERVESLKIEVLTSKQNAYTKELKRAKKDQPAEKLSL